MDLAYYILRTYGSTAILTIVLGVRNPIIPIFVPFMSNTLEGVRLGRISRGSVVKFRLQQTIGILTLFKYSAKLSMP